MMKNGWDGTYVAAHLKMVSRVHGVKFVNLSLYMLLSIASISDIIPGIGTDAAVSEDYFLSIGFDFLGVIVAAVVLLVIALG